MRTLGTLLTALALTAALVPSPALAGTCGVLPFAASEDVKRGAAPNVTQLVSSELDIRGGYDLVIAAPESDFEGGDCGSSSSCIKEFGTANKHEAVVAGRLDMVGDDYKIELKLHDAKTAKLIRQVTGTVPTSPLELASAVTDLVDELVTGKKPADDDAGETETARFDDLDFDDMMDEAVADADAAPKKKRSRAAPRNPGRDAQVEREDDEDPFGLDELDTLDMSAEEVERQAREREAKAEQERRRKADEERVARERAEQERQERLAAEREREDRERARREREDREKQARAEQERRDEEERRRLERDRKDREERERLARAREDEERRESDRMAREDKERRERERLAREDDARRDRERLAREDRARRERESAPKEEVIEEVELGSALGASSGILIGSALDDEDGFFIGADDEDEDYGDEYDPYEDEEPVVAKAERPREGMIIGDDEEDNPGVRRRREADSSDDRYSRARSFSGDKDESARRSTREEDLDEDVDLDDEGGSREEEPPARTYEERSYGSERVASRDDDYLDYDDNRSLTTRTPRSTVARGEGKGQNRPWFSARVSGGYTNYYLHFAQYGAEIGIFPIPRVSIDLTLDFWTLSIRECPECEQEYRTLPSFYLGGSYRFTNLRIVQPHVGGDIGAVVYAVGTLTDELGAVSKRPLMGVAFAAKGGVDFMFTRHFGLGVGAKFGGVYASRIKENVHPDWNPLRFLITGKISAVVQF